MAEVKRTDAIDMADGAEYLFERQQLWALRQGKKLIGSAGTHGRPAYTASLRDNLFEPLSAEAQRDFERGDGGEIGRENGRPAKMQAVHSSSALACNLFHYWRRSGDVGIVLSACGVRARNVAFLSFEAKLPIDSRFRFAPNLDVLVRFAGREPYVLGIECKFTEPFSTRAKPALDSKYLDRRLEDQWRELPALRRLAEQCAGTGTGFQYLDTGQFLKHILGLRRDSPRRCGLLYLFYDVPGEAGVRHAAEVQFFAKLAKSDGVDFAAVTYQQTLLRLARQRAAHGAWVDYMVERYL
jgi:hypothetical protein